MKTVRLSRLTARGRAYRRQGPSMLERHEALWAAGLIENPEGRVYRMSDVEDGWKREMLVYDRLPREVRDMIKYHKGY